MAELITVKCSWCVGDGSGGFDRCEECDGSGTVQVPADLEDRTEKQENLVAALWNFAEEMQTLPHNSKNSKGVSVSLEAVGNARKAIMAAFGVEPVEIQ